jgi:ketosteroid isomerase-like protein
MRAHAVLNLLLCAASLAGCAAAPSKWPDIDELRRQVIDTEKAFARTMAHRDHAGFTSYVSKDAVFLSGPKAVRGREEIARHWKAFFEGPKAPFSWEPEQVEVLESRDLALSTGPVRDPQGKLIGSFTSIWHHEGPATWRIVFDKGCVICDCAKP